MAYFKDFQQSRNRASTLIVNYDEIQLNRKLHMIFTKIVRFTETN